jgi:hypothetical protein
MPGIGFPEAVRIHFEDGDVLTYEHSRVTQHRLLPWPITAKNSLKNSDPDYGFNWQINVKSCALSLLTDRRYIAIMIFGYFLA